MTSKLTNMALFGFASGVSLFAASAALAAGTTAGTTINNTATVDYQVGGVAQPQQQNSTSFIVDRVVRLLVNRVGTTTTEVVPGQNDAYTTFTLRNDSNEVLDFALDVTHLTGGTSTNGGTDNFDVANVRIYLDNPSSGTSGVFDPADTLITHVDELGADQTATLFVVANVPGGRATGDVSGIRLRATAHEGGTPNALGLLVTQTAGANTDGKDTVFGDEAGVNDGLHDGRHSAANDYTVRTATLTVTKSSRVISDPVNETTNPKLIPGAIVEYCIAVANAPGGVAATSVAISDTLTSALTFEAGSIRINGTVTGSTCNADGVTGGSFSDPTVSGTIATIAAGDTRTLVFQATID